jgi:D-glycero-D-manno-heptose 1,7-bisphosphate phosphatase
LDSLRNADPAGSCADRGTGVKNVLLDRDGTIIQERHYLRDPDQVELIPGAGQALKELVNLGCRLFLVTNQSGIARGLLTMGDYRAVQDRLAHLLAGFKVHFTREMICPHHPEEACTCRKPAPGMWTALQSEHRLDPAECVIIGDKVSDLCFGANAGLGASILVLTGHGRAAAQSLGLDTSFRGRYQRPPRPGEAGPTILARDLAAAAAWIARVNGAESAPG